MLFRQLSSNPKTKVILGNDNALIERSYLANYNKDNVVDPQKLKRISEQLVQLHKELNKLNKTLVLLISTNKPSFYPELVPTWYRRGDVRETKSNSDILIEQLRQSGLNPFVTKDFLKQVETETKLRMFEPTGTHWNQYASCRIVSELADRIAQERAQPTRKLNCTVKGKRRKPLDADLDLLHIANLLFSRKPHRPCSARRNARG